jgi:hypothetical protein
MGSFQPLSVSRDPKIKIGKSFYRNKYYTLVKMQEEYTEVAMDSDLNTEQNEIIILSAASLVIKQFVDGSTQTNTKRFFCSASVENGCHETDKYMDHDVVLLSACPRLDDSGVVLVDAWTQTDTIGFLYPFKGTENELSDDETLCDDLEKEANDHRLTKGYKIMNFVLDKVSRFMQRFDHYIPRSSFNRILKLFSVGCAVGMRYSFAIFKRIGCIFF